MGVGEGSMEFGGSARIEDGVPCWDVGCLREEG